MSTDDGYKGPQLSTTPVACADLELTPTPRRRHLTLNENSCNESFNFTYDSGNYSSSSNNSENGVDLQEHNGIILREKEQSLYLALQDMRKLRSELERLSKSEQWYKQELRLQKNTRLESLEKFYTQERKYMRENQRLQRECVRLYAKCGEMEQTLQDQRSKAVDDLKTTKRNQIAAEVCPAYNNNQFEIDQQQALIIDQQKLIVVLRKQKSALLEDLKHLNDEKDEKLHELQSTHADLEVENIRLTTKCKSLLNERNALQDTIQQNATHLLNENTEKLKLQGVITDLSAQLDCQEQLLVHKEREILSLQLEFKSKLKSETNMDEVHQLSLMYHTEINEKTHQILTLKNSLQQLQDELTTLSELNEQNELQARQIENLKFSLETQQLEFAQLQQNDCEKMQQISEFQQREQQLCIENAAILEQLHTLQSAMQRVQQELISLNGRYADMCALCERTKFTLEMREIEYGKLQYAGDSEKREIILLRSKLKDYLTQMTIISKQINDLEQKLERLTKEKAEMTENMAAIENCLSEERKRFKLAEDIIVNNYEDLKELSAKLEQTENTVSNLNKENFKLKELILGHSTNLDNEIILSERLNLLEKGLRTEELKEENEYLKYLVKPNVAIHEEERNVSNLQCNSSGAERKNNAVDLTKESTEAFDELKIENAKLKEELVKIEESKIKLSENLCQMQQRIYTLEEYSNEIEAKHSKEIQKTQECNAELRDLHAKVFDLEQQMKAASIVEEDKRNCRINLLNKLLEQQQNKVQYLNETQLEWEKLLQVLDSTKDLQEKTHKELEFKREEFEELNERFGVQNEALRELQENSFLVEIQTQNEIDTFQQQLNVLREKFNDKHKKTAEQENYIKVLKAEIERKQHHDNGNLQSTRECAVEAEIANLLDKIIYSIEERSEHELNDLRQSKQVQAEEKQASESVNDTANVNIINDDMLKTDLERKVKQYDLHIRKLINYMKILKREVKSAEQKALTQHDETQSQEVHDDVQMSKSNMENLGFDLEKLPPIAASVHDEVPNLIDDYKKLIKQSALVTQRHQTSAILELIQHSNQCVPNLSKLDAALSGLRSDLIQLLAKKNINTPTPKVPTLMEELLAANEESFS